VETAPVSASVLNEQVLAYVTKLAKDGDAAQSRDLAVKLYQVLIQPVQKYFGDGDELCIVPDKALVNLPFAALRAPDTEKFLVESHGVIVAPSANVFRTCTIEARHKQLSGAESVLSIGNPSFSRAAFRDLADLPSAAREAEQVAATYNSEPLLGPRASKTEVEARMPRADVIHFATHYVVNPQSAMASKLVLSQAAGSPAEDDGSLQAYEIYGMKLKRTRVAVLSACQTGVERSYQGEGAIGIARSFISAQVPVVVASLWPVDSDRTAPLMIKFHHYRHVQGLSSTEALRRAQRDMLVDADERLRTPYAWASFVVYGGHASF
jgi:CHAT domain-containing protein